VEAHNAALEMLFTDTIQRVEDILADKVDLGGGDFVIFKREPMRFLAPYLLPVPEKRGKDVKQPKECVFARAVKPFNPDKCHARIWNNGYGAQCSRSKSGDGQCCKTKTHAGGELSFGKFCDPAPVSEDFVWKSVPDQYLPQEAPDNARVVEKIVAKNGKELELDLGPVRPRIVDDVQKAPEGAAVVADRWKSAIVIQGHVREWLHKKTSHLAVVAEDPVVVAEDPVVVAEVPVFKKPIGKMTKKELSEALIACGMAHLAKGRKQELQDRLDEHLENMAKGVGLPQVVEPVEEKPKKKRKSRKVTEDVPVKDEEVIEREAAQAVVDRFAQLEHDPEDYEKEIFDFEDVEYLVDGDDAFDKLNPDRKVGTIDHDEQIIIWLSPEFEREHFEKRGGVYTEESDVDVDEETDEETDEE